MSSEWAEARRVLAVRLDNIGDLIMLGPALRALRAALPTAQITLLASPAGATAAPLLAPWIDDVVVTRALWQEVAETPRFEPEPEREWLHELRNGAFDAAFIFTSFSQSAFPPAYACYLADIPRRYGQAREFGGSVLTWAVEPLPDETHQVMRNLHLLDALGIPRRGDDLEIHVPWSDRAAAAALLDEAGVDAARPFAVLAPGASCEARTYEQFLEVAQRLDASGVPVVVVGGPREAERGEAIVRAAPHAASLAGRTSVPQLAAVIERAAVLVGNHSGPMHLADALRTPMVIAFSGTDLESQWAPRHAPAVLLRRETACAPCRLFDCDLDRACLAIEPGELVAHALRLLTRPAEVVAQ